MLAGQSDARRRAGKLTRALKLLEEDAFWQIKGLLDGTPSAGLRPFTLPWFGAIVRQWQDWQRGIPPSREWSGRSAQNPFLLEAFAALDRAENRARSKPKK